jgi:Ca-activated chloride channel family protein
VNCTRRHRAAAAAGLALLAAPCAADAASRWAGGAQFTSGVALVEVYATVTDQTGAPVTGLTAADFLVRDEGVLQRVTTFAAGAFPLTAAVALDRSFSMRGARLARAKAAARAFVGALRGEDRAMLIAIGSGNETVVPLTTDRAAVLAGLGGLDVWGTTSLYDAALGAIAAVQGAAGRRALVLLSDGVDRYSRTSVTQLVTYGRDTGVLVYPVGVGATRAPALDALAAATGGRSVFVRDLRQLAPTLEGVARELRSQYLLGYVPGPDPAAGRAGPGEWHALEVTVTRPGLKVRARDGYRVR